MKHILVTAIGSFSADAVINNLKQAKYYVVGCDIYSQELLANTLDVDSFYQAPLATGKEGYLEFIYEICEKEKIDYIIPLTDVEVDILNANREFFLEKNVALCISGCESKIDEMTSNRFKKISEYATDSYNFN